MPSSFLPLAPSPLGFDSLRVLMVHGFILPLPLIVVFSDPLPLPMLLIVVLSNPLSLS